jgi:hypothetical protein
MALSVCAPRDQSKYAMTGAQTNRRTTIRAPIFASDGETQFGATRARQTKSAKTAEMSTAGQGEK